MALFWICATAFLFQLSFQAERPVVALRLAELGASHAAIGTTLFFSGLIPLLIGIPMGQMVDRIGARRVLALGSFLTFAGYLALWQSGSPVTVALFEGIATTGVTTCVIALQLQVAEVSRLEDREQNYGWFGTAVAMSQLVGPPIGGLLADRFSITAVFLAAALPGTVPLFTRRLLPADPPRRPGPALASPAPGTTPAHTAWLKLFQLPEVRWSLAAGFLIMLAFNVRTSFFPIYLDELGMTKLEISLLYTLQAVAGLAVRPLLGRLTQWLGRWQVLTAAFVIAVPSFLMLPFVRTWGWIALSTSGLGLTTALTQPLTMSIIAGAAPDDQRGTAMGLRLTAQRLAIVLSPLLLGLVAAASTTGATFTAAGVISIIGVLVSIAGVRSIANAADTDDTRQL